MKDLREVDLELGPLRKWDKIKSQLKSRKSFKIPDVLKPSVWNGIGAENIQDLADVAYHGIQPQFIEESNFGKPPKATEFVYPGPIKELDFTTAIEPAKTVPLQVPKYKSNINKNMDNFVKTLEPTYQRYREESLGNGEKRIYSSIRL